jgi:hypothetical protein
MADAQTPEDSTKTGKLAGGGAPAEAVHAGELAAESKTA